MNKIESYDRKQSLNQLLCILNNKLNSNFEDKFLKYPLVCPISKRRMQYPTRADVCAKKHFECFDLKNYLETSARNDCVATRWKCPICNTPLTLSNLKKCKLVSDMLDHVNNLYPVVPDLETTIEE